MSKAIGPQWQADLAAAKTGETQTTCMCWKIERVTDGKIFYFTDADREITFDGDVYLTTTGFNRSALKTTGDLAAEGMSVVGIFDNSAIKKEDLVKSLFDGARISIFLLDYEDIPKGPIRVGYGRFGAVTQTTGNTFTTEFRDLTQILNQEQGETRSPVCRANLGDKSCNNASVNLPGGMRNPVPIDVPERLDSTAYVVGDVVKVRTGADPLSMAANIVNPDFETGDLTGWNLTNGDFTVQASHVSMNPHSGNFLLRAGPNEPSDLEQKIDFRSVSGFSTANVDAGLVDVRFSIYRGQPNQTIDDPGRVRIFAIDSSLNDIGGALYDTTDETISPNDAWVERNSEPTLPTGAVGVRVLLSSPNVVTDADALFDDISLIIVDRGQTANSSFAFEDRVYRCTTAGTSDASPPTMDTTIGNTTNEGGSSTLVWTAEQAYTVAGEVRSSGDNGSFEVLSGLLTDPLYVEPWFNLGAVIWETGENALLLSENKNVVPPDFELKWPAPFPIRQGDKFRIQPGCNRTRSRCKDFNQTAPTAGARGNLDNMRAEPDLAGLKAFLQTPDAKA